MLRKQKGQALTEFALIFPLFLLLVLGVVEAGRTIWAFITVQQAAREAARFAITGRPWLDSNQAVSTQLNVCYGTEDEADPFVESAEPWLCEEITKTATLRYTPRVEAIKKVALSHGRNLAVSQECLTPDEYFGRNGETCNQQPGAFGVLIQGQVTTETITGTLIVQEEPVENHPGLQGLNVQVNTYYNLKMITPIFDAIMGGNFIQLQGRVQLQNEGLDESAGIEPPPGIAPPPTPGGDPPSDPTSAGIWSQDGYIKQQTDSILVHLDKHTPGATYDIYLENSLDGTKYRICAGIPTSTTTGNANSVCYLTSAAEPPDFTPSVTIPPGNYELFSAQAGLTSPEVYGPEPVTIISGGSPWIEVAGGTIWAANETTQLTLHFHDPGFSYEVRLLAPDGTTELQSIISGHPGTTAPIDWLVPDGVSVCPAIGTASCIIQSRKDDGTEAARTEVKINQPQIVMSPPADTDPENGIAYVRGETVNIFLLSHSPSTRYDISIPNNPGITTNDTNAIGDTATPYAWTIPQDCGPAVGLGNGSYTASSNPQGPDTTIIASTVFEVYTDPKPKLTIDGGTTWNAGSTINIRVLQHLENTEHYLEFDGVRISTGATSDTFITGDCGDAIITFTIPPATIAGPYTIASFDMGGKLRATVNLDVLAKPFIYVLEGDTVMPDQTITIQGTSHVPNTSYAIFYADKFLQSVLAEPNGTFSFPYDLKTLPTSPGPDLTDFNNLGIPYILKSQTVVAPINDVATNTLTIQGADLAVTQVKVAPVAPLSTTVPVDIVVQNMMPVTINSFVDVDFYNLEIPDPDPFGPSYLAGYNFPGDLKFWKNTVGPNEVFSFTHQLELSELGLKSIYGYADVSNNVFENEGSGEVANPNNIDFSALLVNCPVNLASDAFNNAALPDWTTQTYGDGNTGSLASVSGGILSLNSSGSTNWVADDSTGGQLLLQRTGTFTSSAGLDVQVMLSSVDWNGMGTFAKGGLEIRDSLDPTSPKVTWGVARNNGASTNPRQVMQAGYRDTGDSMAWVGGDSFWLNNHTVDLPTGGPVWLRISREPGPNGAVNFYYKQSATPPPALDDDAGQLTYWGGPVQSVSVSGIGDSVVVGLFNASYLSNTAGTSTFDNFSLAVGNTAACDDGSQTGQLPIPPLYEACTQVLDKTSFEGSASSVQNVWKQDFAGGGVILPFTSDGNIGTQSVQASTHDGASRNPRFWQRFTMPDWVISTTTSFDVDLYKWVDNHDDQKNEPDDQFFALVATTNNPNTWTEITVPVMIAQGIENLNWTRLTLPMDIAPGINMENYAGQDLYVHFYNNSNASGACGGTSCKSKFRFDDINLNSCTTEPAPSPVSTRITGKVTLNYSNGTSEALPFVKVWAYAQSTTAGPQPVYETFTIQNGEFNFYNLPPGLYTIFAQYNLVQGTQIETLADDTSVLLQSSNTDTNPAQAFLNLFTLGPLP